jgi:hypothetical protein
VVLLGTPECALAMSHPVMGRSEPDRQRKFKGRSCGNTEEVDDANRQD